MRSPVVVTAIVAVALPLLGPHAASGQQMPPVPGYSDFGWDPGLNRHCAIAKPDGPNGCLSNPYEVTTECNDHRRWIIGFWSENSPTEVCEGNAFDLADAQSTVRVNWAREADNSWDVQFFSDFWGRTHPFGAGYFNWIALMDQGNLATYPPPDRVATFHSVWYHTFIPGGGSAARLIGAWGGHWVSATSSRSRGADIAVNLEGYADVHPDPRVIVKVDDPQTEYVGLDGRAYGLVVDENPEGDPTPQPLVIDWSLILADLTQNCPMEGCLLEPPLAFPVPLTNSTYIGKETYNATASNALVSNLHIQDAKILSKTNLTDLIPRTTTASAAASESYKARDRDAATAWISGGYAPQSIQFDLGAEFTLSRIRILPKHSLDTAGSLTFEHRLLGGPTPTAMALLKTFTDPTTEGVWIDWIPPVPIASVRFFKIETVASPYIVSWSEVELSGSFTRRVRPFEVTASSELAPPYLATDGDSATFWVANAAAPPAQYITLDFGTQYTVKRLRAQIATSASGTTTHRVWAGASLASLAQVHTFSQATHDYDWLDWTSNPVLQGIRYLRLETINSASSFVAWREIEVHKY